MHLSLRVSGIRALRLSRNTAVVGASLSDLLREYIASGASTTDVLSPTALLYELCRQAGFSVGHQQDAAKCLRQILSYTLESTQCTVASTRWTLCDSGADIVDGGVLLCYTPDVAQVSAVAAAVDMAALLHQATTDDGALHGSPQALVIRVENTDQEAGSSFWLNACVTWLDGPLRMTTKTRLNLMSITMCRRI
jgi:hypothetical protein